MPAFDVTIGNKTYHVDIPRLDDSTLELIVDGKPFEICIGSDTTQTPFDAQLLSWLHPASAYDPRLPAAPGPAKTVKAEWHASCCEE